MKLLSTVVLALAVLGYSSGQDKRIVVRCGGKICSLEEACYIQRTRCNRYPCLAIPICVPLNPCLTTDCILGYRCIVKFQGSGVSSWVITRPQASCIPSWQKCSSDPCTNGTTCTRRPYFPESGLCVPDTYGQLCQGQQCRHGELCHNGICVKVQGPICQTDSNYCDFIL